MAVSGKGPAPREVPYSLLNDTPDAEAEGKAVAEKLSNYASFGVGLLAARPEAVANNEGHIYWATDDTTFGPNGTWWVSYGTAWHEFPLPAVTTAMLVAGCVTAAKLAEEAVGTTAIANLAVTEDKLADALLGPAAAAFGLRSIGQGALEAMAGNDPRVINRAYLGDGSDGVALFDGATEHAAFATRASSTYTLIRDVYASEITVNAGVTIKTSGFMIFCTGLVTNKGVIENVGGGGGKGNESTGGTAGIGGTEGTLKGGLAGGAGGIKEEAGKAGNNITESNGGAGGKGGVSNSAKAGGVGGTATARTGGINRNLAELLRFRAFAGGAGGGGGGGAGLGGGGGGGGGGGCILIACRVLNNASGTITVNGGAGGVEGENGGGGGGGGGGCLVLAYTEQVLAGTASVGGGSPGIGGVGGSPGALIRLVG